MFNIVINDSYFLKSTCRFGYSYSVFEPHKLFLKKPMLEITLAINESFNHKYHMLAKVLLSFSENMGN